MFMKIKTLQLLSQKSCYMSGLNFAGNQGEIIGLNSRNDLADQDILFGKSRLWDILNMPAVQGVRMYFFSHTGYDGIQVIFVGTDAKGRDLVDMKAWAAKDPDKVHATVVGIGLPNQAPMDGLFWGIDWETLYLQVRMKMLELEELGPDAGCPDCGLWDEGAQFP